MANTTRRALWRRIMVVVLTVGGIALCVVLLRSVAAADLRARLLAVRGFVPFLLGLELGRALCELGTTLTLLGHDRVRVGWLQLMRVQCAAFALNTLMPAGRAASEAAKAALFTSSLGAPRAVAVGAGGQTLTLAVNASSVLVAAVLALASQLPTTIVWALLSYAAISSTLALSLVVAARWPGLRLRLRRWPRLCASLERFGAIREEPGSALGRAALCQVGVRVCQTAQVAVLMYALEAPVDLSSAILAQGLYVAGGAAGDLVPAQLGPVDTAFVLAARGFGLSQAGAVVLSLTMHAVQLTGALLSLLAAAALWFGVRRPRAENAPSEMTRDRQTAAGTEP